MSFYGETEVGGPNGLTYAVLVTRLAHDELLEILTAERFSGWVGPTEDGWTVAVPESPLGHVASHRRRLPELAEAISDRTDAVVASVVVVKDALLRLWAGRGGGQLVDYVSDPSVGAEDVPLELDPFGNPVGISDGPVGAHGASALARAADRAQAADELQELLAERLGESENESERLQAAARLLGWPSWLVAVDSLPRRVPGGPDASAFTRLRAGRGGIGGIAAAQAARVVRRKA
ncbi:MAG: hypothetical protein B7X40_07530 [Cellulomonas sp. 14-74-6]|nr:MAG: hypothetical protein B7X40_07530 [Cellulomonas sp. 14-74-6]